MTKEAGQAQKTIVSLARFFFLLTSFFFFLFSGISFACSCAFQTPQAHFDQAEIVFIGKAVDIRSSWGKWEVKFEVIEFEKADEDDIEDKVLVYTALDEAQCGYTFEKNGVYQVFVNTENGRWMTNLCSGNQRLRGLER